MQREILKRGGKMKITKRQLRRIIKEERAKLLREDPRGMSSQQLQNKAKGAAMSLIEMGEDMHRRTGSEFSAYVVQQANLVMDYLVAMEEMPR